MRAAPPSRPQGRDRGISCAMQQPRLPQLRVRHAAAAASAASVVRPSSTHKSCNIDCVISTAARPSSRTAARRCLGLSKALLRPLRSTTVQRNKQSTDMSSDNMTDWLARNGGPVRRRTLTVVTRTLSASRLHVPEGRLSVLSAPRLRVPDGRLSVVVLLLASPVEHALQSGFESRLRDQLGFILLASCVGNVAGVGSGGPSARDSTTVQPPLTLQFRGDYAMLATVLMGRDCPHGRRPSSF